MTAIKAQPKNRLVLFNVPWQTYERLSRMFAETQVRITFDRGMLEIMTLTFGHESYSYLLGRFVDALTEELKLPIVGGGSTTFKRRRKKRGLEPDKCYWIASEHLVRGKLRINLAKDPPPDLAIEIDVSRSSLDRMSIYAALGIPEVWRYDGTTLTFHGLAPDGTYAAVAQSLAFPSVAPADLQSFLVLRGQTDDNGVIRQFRSWVRQRHGLSSNSP